MTDFSTHKVVIGAILILVVLVGIIYISRTAQMTTIQETMRSRGFTIVNIDEKIFDYGPFHWYEKSKSETIYEISYIDTKGLQKTVWFRGGGWSDLWRNPDGTDF